MVNRIYISLEETHDACFAVHPNKNEESGVQIRWSEFLNLNGTPPFVNYPFSVCSDMIHNSFSNVIQVDVLGDEVETLLSVLGKIYIALDHYSPVLKHYPGVRALLHKYLWN